MLNKFLFQSQETIYKYDKLFSSKALKPITIRWIKTGSEPDWKNMYSIKL